MERRQQRVVADHHHGRIRNRGRDDELGGGSQYNRDFPHGDHHRHAAGWHAANLHGHPSGVDRNDYGDAFDSQLLLSTIGLFASGGPNYAECAGGGAAIHRIGPSGGNWLSVVSNGSATPGVLTVSVNPSALAVGTYQGTVTVTSSAATNSPLSIPVTFTVSAAPVLTAAPNALSFSYQQNGSLPGSQNLVIGTSGSHLDYTIVAGSYAPWLTAIGPGPAPATVTVSVNTTGLAPGTYQGNVILIAPAAGNSPFIVPVSLTVSATPNLIAAPTSLSVTYRQLDPPPAPIHITVTSSGATLSFTPSVSPGTTWLTLSGISGFHLPGRRRRLSSSR